MSLSVGYKKRLIGTANADYLRKQKQSDQAAIRGTQIAVVPQSSKGSICGRLIDSSVNVNGLGGIPITPNTIGPGALATNFYAAPLFEPDPTFANISAQASLTGLLQDIFCQPVFLNIPQDGSVIDIYWCYRKTGTDAGSGEPYPWIFQGSTQIQGLPDPPLHQRGAYGFGQVASGIGYDFGAAYVSIQREIGEIGIFATDYVAPFDLAIPNHYMIGHKDYVPTYTVGIAANTGFPNIYPAAVADYIVEPQANGLTHSIQIAFQITNQPTTGSLARINLWARNAKTNKADLTGYTNYSTIVAAGVGLEPSALPTIGNYVHTFLDLINAGGYDFAFSCEATDSDETDLVYLPITAPPPPVAQPGIVNGSVNLVVDSDFNAAAFNGGDDAGSDVYWAFWNINGTDKGIAKQGSPDGGQADIGNCMFSRLSASGQLYYGISYVIDTVAGLTHTFSAEIHSVNCGPDAYVALCYPPAAGVHGRNQGGTPNIIPGTIVKQDAGVNGRVSGTWTAPADGSVPKVYLILSTNNNSISSPGYQYMGKPMFQCGPLSGYVSGPATPGGQITQEKVSIATPGSNADQAVNAPSITASTSPPVNGSSATAYDQQPQASLRMVQGASSASASVYTQTATDATNPVWQTLTGASTILVGASFPSTATQGEPFFRTDQLALYIYNSGAWVRMSAQYLYELYDVAFSSQADGEVLTWHAATSQWINKALPVPTLASDTDVDFTTAGTDKFLAKVTSGSKAYSFVGPAYALANDSDIDFTTGGAGKLLAQVASSGKSYSFVTPVAQELANDGDIDFTTAGTNKFLAQVASGGKSYSFVAPAAPSIAGCSDIDFTTAGAGKVLSQTPSGGKAYSFVPLPTGATETFISLTDVDNSVTTPGAVLTRQPANAETPITWTGVTGVTRQTDGSYIIVGPASNNILIADQTPALVAAQPFTITWQGSMPSGTNDDAVGVGIGYNSTSFTIIVPRANGQVQCFRNNGSYSEVGSVSTGVRLDDAVHSYKLVVTPSSGSTQYDLYIDGGTTPSASFTDTINWYLGSIILGAYAYEVGASLHYYNIQYLNGTIGLPFKMIVPTPTLASDTDIDWTTAGTGKVLAVVPSGGKPYSFITPAAGGGGSSGTAVAYSGTAASNGLYPSSATLAPIAGQVLKVRTLVADCMANHAVAIGNDGGWGIKLKTQSDGNVVVYVMSGTNSESTYILASGSGNGFFSYHADAVLEISMLFCGSAGVMVTCMVNGYPILPNYGSGSGFNSGWSDTLLPHDLTSSAVTIYTDLGTQTTQYVLKGATDF